MGALQSFAKSRVARARDEGDQLHRRGLEQFARADWDAPSLTSPVAFS